MIKAFFSKYSSSKNRVNLIRKMSCHNHISETLQNDQCRKINMNNTIELSALRYASKVPSPTMENILVTSALPYVNNSPHIGNIIGCVLSADAYAKYCRLRGKNCMYICGTDEYGTATEVRALQEKTTCEELCSKYFLVHKQIYEWLNIDFDCFGRTSTDNHTKLTQDIYSDLKENGHIIKETIDQLYCEEHKRFLADRYVEGTCPICKYEDARGDQCDQCGNVFDTAAAIINPKCKVDGSTPVIKQTKHLFINLPAISPKLKCWADKASKQGNWSSNNVGIIDAWFNVGLKPRCITRDLSWGVPVNEEGYDEKVFYVWFDACIGYPSITADYIGEDWKKWWMNPENVKLYQFMGKDNSSFHTIVFPSMQLGTGKKWTMLHHINTAEFLQYEKGKFSKSRGYGVFGDDLMKLDISPSVWRYYLLQNRPEKSDSTFSWNHFAISNNSDLLGCLGNLVNRVLTFCKSKYNSIVPEYNTNTPREKELITSVNRYLSQYIESFEAVKIKSSVKLALEIANIGNKYLQDSGLNNKLYETDTSSCSTVIGVSINFIYLLSAIFYPITTGTSLEIYNQLNVPPRKIEDIWTCCDILPGHKINTPAHLFKSLTPEQLEKLKKQFGAQENLPDEPIVSNL